MQQIPRGDGLAEGVHGVDHGHPAGELGAVGDEPREDVVEVHVDVEVRREEGEVEHHRDDGLVAHPGADGGKHPGDDAGEGQHQQRQQQYAHHQRRDAGGGVAHLHAPYHGGGSHDQQLQRIVYGQQHDHARAEDELGLYRHGQQQLVVARGEKLLLRGEHAAYEAQRKGRQRGHGEVEPVQADRVHGRGEGVEHGAEGEDQHAGDEHEQHGYQRPARRRALLVAL